MFRSLVNETLNDRYVAISVSHTENLEYAFPNYTLILSTQCEANIQKNGILDIRSLLLPSFSQKELHDSTCSSPPLALSFLIGIADLGFGKCSINSELNKLSIM
ncbi:hypothetical protein CDAR_60501 [Caerostris darwini]|uniref:Uncharacterized protein n=1 Tax=Caerostris darwini TaxID=1538125 RepID=A0AAV4WBF7_9ARAC|nr:hypothetical protein CDAR_60501 [Caerostris darwini]